MYLDLRRRSGEGATSAVGKGGGGETEEGEGKAGRKRPACDSSDLYSRCLLGLWHMSQPLPPYKHGCTHLERSHARKRAHTHPFTHPFTHPRTHTHNEQRSTQEIRAPRFILIPIAPANARLCTYKRAVIAGFLGLIDFTHVQTNTHRERRWAGGGQRERGERERETHARAHTHTHTHTLIVQPLPEGLDVKSTPNAFLLLWYIPHQCSPTVMSAYIRSAAATGAVMTVS